jgi:CubicO group peptidase (beta-lactamase class C family)
MLLHRGESIISSQTTEAMTARQRAGIHDKTFNHIIDWGLGFLLQSTQYGVEAVPYNYGPHASLRTFGHSGARSSVGYCDPEHALVVACIFNGKASEEQHDARMREINALIYEELKLT